MASRSGLPGSSVHASCLNPEVQGGDLSLPVQERIYEFTHLDLWLFAVAPTASVGQGTPYEAFGWAFLATASLLISAWIGSFSHPSKRITAVMLAFSAGLLISLLSYDLLEVAYETAGLVPALFGFFVGLCLFVLFNRLLQSRGVQRRCSVTHGGLRQESLTIPLKQPGWPW